MTTTIKMKPTLVEESSTDVIPPNLETLIKSIATQPDDIINVNDVIVVVMFVLMMETGFTLRQSAEDSSYYGYDFNIKKLRSVTKMPAAWRLENLTSYRLLFVLQPFLAYSFQLDVSKNTADNFISVSFSSKDKEGVVKQTTTISFPPAVYVVNVNTASIPTMFTSLQEFSIEFKNRISLPVRNRILQDEYIMHGSIEGIPTEIKAMILEYLSPDDVVKMSRTCKMMNCFLTGQSMWKYMFQRDFGNVPSMMPLKMTDDETDAVNWRDNFIRCRKQQVRYLRFVALQRTDSEISNESEDVFFDVEDGGFNTQEWGF